MSASPTQPTNSAKRPLEEASSPSRATDQPEAKRPALDKVIKNDEEAEVQEETAAPEASAEAPEQNGDDDDANGVKGDHPDLPDVLDPKAAAATVASTSATAANSASAHDETSWIHIRAVISSPEAATIIGKGGENVSNIRKMSNAKCTVSDYQKGAVERILTVSGIVDAVAKVSSIRVMSELLR
jgi:heterogeneous nuclear rnp K-like protein